MDKYNMTPEDFIYAPSTVALILDNESISIAHLEQGPGVVFSKPLSGGYTVVYVNESDIDKVIVEPENYTTSIYPLVLGLMGVNDLNASGILQVQRQPFLNLSGSGVLLGFIDTGIDYTNKAFIYEDGSSKIQYIWDQTIRGNPPAGCHYGSEYDNETINRALKSENPFEIVPHRDTVGHGTFLASIAGSREIDGHIGAAPDAEIIVVKMRRSRAFDSNRFLIPREQENAYSSDDLMIGVQYIIDKAQELERPVAICISVGTNLGAHDGFFKLEGYLAKIAGYTGKAICAAAGNEGTAGHHVQRRIASTGESQAIEMRASNKHEDIYISIWNFASDRLSVAVKSPTGEIINRVPARSGTSYKSKLILERATVIVEYTFPVERSGGQLTRVKILSATPGVWTITVYGDSILDGTFHAWLPIVGFINPDTQFLSPTRYYTVVLPATSMGVITCGAYNSKDNSLYVSTSFGPSRLPSIKPDLVAPGVDVSGLYPTGPGNMSGTSVSAAITAGASALMLQWGIVEKNDTAMDSYRIRANLIAGCIRHENDEFPNNQWGYGRLNLYNTFRSLRPY